MKARDIKKTQSRCGWQRKCYTAESFLGKHSVFYETGVPSRAHICSVSYSEKCRVSNTDQRTSVKIQIRGAVERAHGLDDRNGGGRKEFKYRASRY